MKNTKKRVVFINNLGLGGAERVVSRLLSNNKMNKSLALWTLNSNSFYNDRYILSKLNLQYGKFTFLNVLNNLLKLDRGSIVQAHLNQPILYSALAKMLGAKFELQAVHCFAYSSFYKRRGIKGKIHKLIYSLLLKKVNVHIFKAKEMVEDFKEVFGWCPSNYSVIYNPYDIDEIITNAQDVETTGNYFNNDKMNVAIVGRLNASKRVLDIIDIAKETKSFAVYHFFGDGPLYETLNTKLQVLDIKNVIIHGMVSNPFKYVKQCGVYLSLSESEGFPNALIESMICNAIPIHTDCKTGPKEILSDDFSSCDVESGNFVVAERGLLFPVGDIQGAVKAIRYVFNNQSKLSTIFENRHKQFTQSVSIDKILAEYAKILKLYN